MSLICILGPDGSGKSEVASKLMVLFQHQGMAAARFHWRPRYLLSLSKGSGPQLPIRGRDRSALASALGGFFFAMDFCVGYYFGKVNPQVSGNVIYERYFYDVLVDPARYRLTDMPRFFRFLCGLVPMPDLVVFLHSPNPEVIHSRKPELSVNEIAYQQRIIRERLGALAEVLEYDVSKLSSDEISEEIYKLTTGS
jgi:thymidylate kinase